METHHSTVVSGESHLLHHDYLPRGKGVKAAGPRKVFAYNWYVVSLSPYSIGQSSHWLCPSSWIEKQTPTIDEGVRRSRCRRASGMRDTVGATFGKYTLPHLPL